MISAAGPDAEGRSAADTCQPFGQARLLTFAVTFTSCPTTTAAPLWRASPDPPAGCPMGCACLPGLVSTAPRLQGRRRRSGANPGAARPCVRSPQADPPRSVQPWWPDRVRLNDTGPVGRGIVSPAIPRPVGGEPEPAVGAGSRTRTTKPRRAAAGAPGPLSRARRRGSPRPGAPSCRPPRCRARPPGRRGRGLRAPPTPSGPPDGARPDRLASAPPPPPVAQATGERSVSSMNRSSVARGTRFWRPNHTNGSPLRPPVRSHSTVSSGFSTSLAGRPSRPARRSGTAGDRPTCSTSSQQSYTRD